MLRHVTVGPTSTTGYGGSSVVSPPWQWPPLIHPRLRIISSVNQNQAQNHYTVLGVSQSASSSDIKKAFRLLARQWHPDVSNDSQAGEVFKSIHLAYQVLSNEATRIQYDRVLKSHEHGTESIRKNTYYDSRFEDEIRMHRWQELRKKMPKYHKFYEYGKENESYYTESDEESEGDILDVEERGSFIEVLRSVFLSIFLMRTVGCQLSLLFSSLMALADRKLDGGYKLGYLIAFVMGGRAGILLSMCLVFTSWACGKNSSGMVVLVVVAMWVGSNVLSFTPLPQGALLALLYMSIKLQVDSN